MGAKVSLREYARIRGVSLTAVQKAIKTGRIKTTPEGRIDIDQANQEWFQNTDPSKTKTIDPYFEKEFNKTIGEQSGAPNFQKVKAAEVFYRAMTVKTKLRILEDKLIDKKVAGDKAFQLGQAVKNEFITFPARYSALIAAELGVDEHKVMVILDEYIRKFLSECKEFIQ